MAEACSIAVMGDEVCPGGTVEVVVSGGCSPNQCINSMNWSITSTSPHISSAFGSVLCVGKSVPTLLSIAPDAPLGPIPITVTGTMPSGTTCTGSSTVTVREGVHLTFAGVADADEETVGGFLCRNEDDDNGNGVPDLNDPGPTVGEDDLRPLTVSVSGGWNGSGSVTLTCESGCTKIMLYENPDRSMPVALQQSWTIPTTELPKTFHVEGIVASDAVRDVEFKALYTGSGGPCEDRVKMTVVKTQLESIDFVNGATLRTDETSTLPNPEWVRATRDQPNTVGPYTANQSAPAAYVKSSPIVGDVTVSLVPPLDVTLRLVGNASGAASYGSFSELPITILGGTGTARSLSEYYPLTRMI